jgi:serine/threonine protein kinase
MRLSSNTPIRRNQQRTDEAKMSMLSAKIQAGFEPIAGYVLKEKLGSGGYGDVWSADAPGGLQKAIKIVHGSIDESRAANELKSLQRIRQVNHPFILSLERIEVVESQLIIVTELAQCSLLDRYAEYREKGFSGIARDRLINYLKDAAEGLDFLCQKHDLQHLDVKPGNLLLVSDRIKVADFGLVKDLQSNTQSLMGGLTPTYAAPEMFDGRPGRYSDQYSLAIVYQEMLTGSLPFRGRTTAQLANEHLHKAPSLDELSASERAVLAKALAKKPQQRFSDCKEMVSALDNAAKSDESAESAPIVQVRGWSPNLPKDKSRTLGGQTAMRNSAHVAANPRSRLLGTAKNPVVAEPVVQHVAKVDKNRAPTVSHPELVIGVGGMAIDVLNALRRQISAQAGIGNASDRFLVLDTDSRALEPLVDRSNPGRLDYGSVVHLAIKSPNYYREETQPFPQLSRRWVYNIPRSQQTEGVRPLGMLALLDHASLVFDRLQIALSDLIEQEGTKTTFRVRLISSLMGGTGSAMVTELGFMVRQAAETLGIAVQVELICTCASPCPTALGDLASASAMACLLEINHYFRTGGLHPGLPMIPDSGIHRPPFDHVRVIYGGQLGNDRDKAETAREIAALLLARSLSLQYDPIDTSADSSGCKWASTIRTTMFPIDIFSDPRRSAATSLLQSVVPWIASMNHATEPKESAIGTGKSSNKQTEKIKFLVGDLFRESNWNAQAWVCECMKCIAPESRGLEVASTVAESHESETVDKDYMDFLPLISEQLGIPIIVVAKGVRSLFAKSMSQLETTLKEKWMISPSNWEAFPSLLESIQVQLKLNANSLFTVAQRLSEKHDELIEMVVSSNDTNRELDAQLSKLAIESTFHVVAGRLLVRIAMQLEPFRISWQQVSLKLRLILSTYCEQLSTQVLGKSIEKFLEAKSPQQNQAALKKGNAELISLVSSEWVAALSRLAPTSEGVDRSTERNIQKILDELLGSLKTSIETKGKTEVGETQDLASGTSSFDKTIIGAHVSTGATSNQNPGSSGKTTSDDPYDLDARISSGVPHLVDFGSQLKKTLIISSVTWSQIPEELQERIESQCDIEIRKEYFAPTLLCEANDLNLEDMIDKVWMPTDETWHLVPRVLSRVDVEWIPFNLVSPQA